MKYNFIHSHRKEYRITRMCAVLDVSTSGYYDWLDRPESERSREHQRLTQKIRHYHQQSNAIYGSPKIHEDLLADGETCNVKQVARLMKKADIQSKMARKFVITTHSKNTTQPAPDLLQRQFVVPQRTVFAVNQATVGWCFWSGW